MKIDGNIRLGFVQLVHNERRANDGGPLYIETRQENLELAEAMGWRLYNANDALPEIKAFDPEAARILAEQKALKERSEMAKLQERVKKVVLAGGIPELEDLKAMTDQEFEEALAELTNAEESETQTGEVVAKGRPGRKPKEQ